MLTPSFQVESQLGCPTISFRIWFCTAGSTAVVTYQVPRAGNKCWPDLVHNVGWAGKPESCVHVMMSQLLHVGVHSFINPPRWRSCVQGILTVPGSEFNALWVVVSLNPPYSPIIIPILWIKTVQPREVDWKTQGQTTTKGGSWTLNLGSLMPGAHSQKETKPMPHPVFPSENIFWSLSCLVVWWKSKTMPFVLTAKESKTPTTGCTVMVSCPEIVIVFHCCVTHYHKLRGLNDSHYYLTVSTH